MSEIDALVQEELDGSASFEDKLKKAVDEGKAAEAMIYLSDTFTTFPTSTFLDMFVDALKHSVQASQMFGLPFKEAKWNHVNCDFPLDVLGVKILSDTITKVTKCNFAKTIDGPKANRQWKEYIKGPEGIKMGYALFQQMMHDKFDFYFFELGKWNILPKVEKLLKFEPYIIGTIVKQMTSESSLPVMLKVYFLKVLGSGQVDNVLKRWTEVMGDSSLEHQVREFLDSHNFLERLIGKLDADILLSSVVAACNKVTRTDHEIIYGLEVEKFIKWSTNGPKMYGLLTGQDPENREQC